MDKKYKQLFEESIDSFIKNLKDPETVKKAKYWIQRNQSKLNSLFNYSVIRDFIFEPIKEVFNIPDQDDKRAARVIITQVAVVNAVIAGLPGSLGVGVFVSIALEFWMAFSLSKVVGLTLSQDEVIDTVIAWALGAGMILIVFKQALNFVFPIITAVMPFAGPGTALTQLIVTNLFGVVLWILFEELKSKKRFQFPIASANRLYSELSYLIKHQWSAGIPLINPANWVKMGKRLYGWLTGEIFTNIAVLRGELAPTVAMAWLLSGDYDKLSGPLGEEFIHAIRDRFPKLADSSLDDMSTYMASTYEVEEIPGVINLIKGKLFERLVNRYENEGSDKWQSFLHEDESYPGSDMILTNYETGETIEISLKASNSIQYLEESLLKYPELPIIATDEVAGMMKENDLIWAAGITNEDLKEITEDNFEYLVERLDTVPTVEAAASSVLIKASLSLWPFVISYMRGRISKEQLTRVCNKVFPELGSSLASRLAYSVALGPVFAWWLLARGVMKVTADKELSAGKQVRRLRMR